MESSGDWRYCYPAAASHIRLQELQYSSFMNTVSNVIWRLGYHMCGELIFSTIHQIRPRRPVHLPTPVTCLPRAEDDPPPPPSSPGVRGGGFRLFRPRHNLGRRRLGN